MTREFLEYILRPVESWDKHNYAVDVNYFENIAALSPADRAVVPALSSFANYNVHMMHVHKSGHG